MIAAAQHTIVDLSDPVVSGTEPLESERVLDMLWLDTSSSPAVLKRWTGAEWETVDETIVGGRNLLFSSGDFVTANEDWEPIHGAFLSANTVDGESCLHAESDPEAIIGSAAIRQTRSYLLEFDTTYVYHAKYMLSRSGVAAKLNPLSFYASVVSDYDDEPTNRNAVAGGDSAIEFLSDPAIEVGRWVHTVLRFKTCAKEDESTAQYILFQPRLEGSLLYDLGESEELLAHLWLQWIMLEKGNKPSDWQPAPEDIREEVDDMKDTVTELESRIRAAEIKIEDEAIIATVLSSDKYTNKIESLEGNLQLAKDAFNVSFTEINEQIKANEADHTAFRNEVTSWLNFSKDAVLEIGKTDSDFKMNLSNTELAFLYKNTKMAYFGTDNGLYIGQATIRDSLTIGNITMISDEAGRMIWV